MIRNVTVRYVIGIFGEPAMEAKVELADHSVGTAVVSKDAFEDPDMIQGLRPHEQLRSAQSVLRQTVEAAEPLLREWFQGMDGLSQQKLDQKLTQMIQEMKVALPAAKRCGSVLMLSVSLAAARAAAQSLGVPLYRYLGGVSADRIPQPLYAMVEKQSQDRERLEVLLLPAGNQTLQESMYQVTQVWHVLEAILCEAGVKTGMGRHGIYLHDMKTDEEALEYILRAAEDAGFLPEQDFRLVIPGKNGIVAKKILEKYPVERIPVPTAGIPEICTVTRILREARLAGRTSEKLMIGTSYRETNDSFCADVAAAVCADYFRIGIPGNGQGTANINRLLEIANELEQAPLSRPLL